MGTPSAPRPNTYRFASFELDAFSGELRKHGYRVPLQDQPFRILCLLIERPNELVTREQIREALWAADTFVDFDRSLNKAMVKLRQALDDDAEEPRFIETLPKRGYRFLVPVEVSTPARRAEGPTNAASPPVSGNPATNRQPGSAGLAPPAEPNSIPSAPVVAAKKQFAPWRVFSWTTRILAAIACIGLAIALLPARWRDGLTQALFRSPIRSLAVLPLLNFSGDPAQDYFVDGMTDELTASLARIPNLRVTSRTTMGQYRDKHLTVPQIARELQVDAILEGSVLRVGDRVRITTQLIDARRDQHLWAQSYERNLTDILQVQNEIAGEVATQVEKSMSNDFYEHRSSLGTTFAATTRVRPDAYDDFLRGRSELTKQNPEAMKKAAEYFQAAINNDPEYARAYAGLADAYNLMANYQVLPPTEAYPRAREAANKALALDRESAEAHAALALIHHHYDWDWASAEKEYKRAIELQPNYATAHHRYAWFLTDVGRHDEAIQELRRAQALDPQSIVVATNLGRTLYHARRYDEAIDQLKVAVAMDPNRFYSHVFLALVYEAKKMCPEALQEIQILQSLNGGLDNTAAAHVYAACGRGEDARKALAILSGSNEDPVQDWAFVSADYAALGETDHAFQWLERAFEHRDFFLTELKTHPYFDPLRSDPRFEAFIQRMKFPE